MTTIFTDGSCNVKSKLGGIGIYIIKETGEENYISKGYFNTTISRMEMRALLEGFKSIEDKTKDVIFYLDSEFIVKSLTIGWFKSWKKNNFLTVKNNDIWLLIDKEISKFTGKITIKHTKGHRKDLDNPIAYGNATADILADYRSFKEYKQDLK